MKKAILLKQIMLISSILLIASCTSKITLEMIESDLVGRQMGGFWDGWTFTEKEPRKIKILKEGYKDEEATIVINMDTRDGGPDGEKYSGKIRLKYEWIGDDWDLVEIENLSFKRNR